jgi:hypothetical protein
MRLSPSRATRWRKCAASTAPEARKVLGWPKKCKLAHACLCEYSYKRLKLAQLRGQRGVCLTLGLRASLHRTAQQRWPFYIRFSNRCSHCFLERLGVALDGKATLTPPCIFH